MHHQNDTILFISHSGKTPELLNLLPHIPATTPILAMSSQTSRSDCPLIQNRKPELGILLPAPIPVSEEASFGVSAPTTSTTVTGGVQAQSSGRGDWDESSAGGCEGEEDGG
jgi:D-arabinose 5-phosphate isomerase GutQ